MSHKTRKLARNTVNLFDKKRIGKQFVALRTTFQIFVKDCPPPIEGEGLGGEGFSPTSVTNHTHKLPASAPYLPQGSQRAQASAPYARWQWFP